MKKPISYLSKITVIFALVVITSAAFIATFQYIKPNDDNLSLLKGNKTSSQPNNAGKTESSNPPSVQIETEPELVLVNFDNKMPDDFKQKIVKKSDVYMDERIIEPFNKMQKDASKENLKIWISSGYRSTEKQKVLYEKEIEAFNNTGLKHSDAVDKASKSVARPGYSEHNTGLALDLNGVLDNFSQTKEYEWLQLHAQDYGFVLRYPKDKQDITKIKFEPWHYRYVGVEHAKKMKELNMCLEEYVQYVNQNKDALH